MIGDGTLKILDLGLARLQEPTTESTAITNTNQIMGTLDYIAPEQSLDARSVDGRSDLYSLGCTMYHLLSGQGPFHGPEFDTAGKKMLAHVQSEPEPLGRKAPDVPAGVSGIVHRLMAKAPEQRFQSAGETANALEPFCVYADLPRLVERYRSEDQSGRETEVAALDTIDVTRSPMEVTASEEPAETRVLPAQPSGRRVPPWFIGVALAADRFLRLRRLANCRADQEG